MLHPNSQGLLGVDDGDHHSVGRHPLTHRDQGVSQSKIVTRRPTHEADIGTQSQ